MESILILNAAAVNAGAVAPCDVWIRSGRIEQLGSDLGGKSADIIIDAAGKTLMPGMIDDQVHFREPGLTHKGDLASESRAAVAGGITSYMDMPNTQPATTTRKLLEEKFTAAAGRSFANYTFYLGATNDNLEEIQQLSPKSCCGVKIFMGASTGNLLVDDPDALENIFAHAPTLIAAHCEDTPTILANEARMRSIYGEDVPMSEHPNIRSVEACYRSSALAVDLARRHGSRLHILHLTSAKETALLSNRPLEEKRITGEVCVHHLYFDQSDYARHGTRIKCNPAIKSAGDRQALLDAVCENRIDVIATDHAPHTLAEKQAAYFSAPSGLPLVQHALVSLLEHYHAGIFTLPLIAEKTAHAPARLFHIKDRGYIREGYWADLVMVDLNRPQAVDEEALFYRCGWSPFQWTVFRSSVEATVVSGELVYRNGQVNPVPQGRRLEFE
jgi:dihydroorotase